MMTEGGEGVSHVFLREEHSRQREQSFNSHEAATSLLCLRTVEVQFDLNKVNEEEFYEMRPGTKGGLIL